MLLVERLLITGASGLLGSNLALDLAARYRVYGLVNTRMLDTEHFAVLQGDLLEEGVLELVIDEAQPDAIIHCAGMTKIDRCERYPRMAYQLNAKLPERLAGFTSKSGIKLVYISTATVFNGERGGYSEKDQPDPLSVYAKTKLAGERGVAENDSNALIARVSLFGWSPSGKRSLAEYFYNQLRDHQEVIGFTDVIFCPLLVNHLSPLFVKLMEGDFRGLYHVVGSSCVSKYEFGTRIAERFGFDQNLIHRGSVDEMEFLGERSHNLTLENTKLTRRLDVELPELSTGIDRFYTLYQQGYPQYLQGMLRHPSD